MEKTICKLLKLMFGEAYLTMLLVERISFKKTNIRRCFSPPERHTSWTSPTSPRCPWSSDWTNGRFGTEPPVPTASQQSARGPSGEQRTSGVRYSSSIDILGRDVQSRSIWLRRSQFKGSGRWPDGPGDGIFYGPSAFRSAGCGV